GWPREERLMGGLEGHGMESERARALKTGVSSESDAVNESEQTGNPYLPTPAAHRRRTWRRHPWWKGRVLAGLSISLVMLLGRVVPVAALASENWPEVRENYLEAVSDESAIRRGLTLIETLRAAD